MNAPIPSERTFGLSVGGVCLALAGVLAWRGYSAAPVVFGVVGALLVCFGATYPPALRMPNRIWWRFAQALGWFNTRVILTAFFALVLTPAGILMRLVGRNPLRPTTTGTNWTPYPARRADPRHYEHLF